jgi:hypothetical protein
MKPTISNAFNDRASSAAASDAKNRMSQTGNAFAGFATGNPSDASAQTDCNPLKNLAASLASMQVDLRETEFGWSIELSPMSAIDAIAALVADKAAPAARQFLVSLEQSAWRENDAEMSLAAIAHRLCIAPLDGISDQQLVLDELSLRELVSLCQPTRLLVVAVDGAIDARDAAAINRAIDAGLSPLLAELRADFALEVLGDRNVVLHCRTRSLAGSLVADNFRHYLAALLDKPAARFTAPQSWQLERLLDDTGVITVRPIETDVFGATIDVGINTSRQRFEQPANHSLVYDVPSDTWHDES